jgi:hypothetical protein
MFMSFDHNGAQIHNVKTDSSYFDRMEEFRYLGTTLMNQISFRKKLRAD